MEKPLNSRELAETMSAISEFLRLCDAAGHSPRADKLFRHAYTMATQR